MKYVVIIAALFLSGCFGSEGTGDLKAYVKSTLNKP